MSESVGGFEERKKGLEKKKQKPIKRARSQRKMERVLQGPKITPGDGYLVKKAGGV